VQLRPRYISAVSAADDYRISTDPALLDIELIHRFLSRDSYWAQNIPLGVVQRSIAQSLCFGLYEAQRQIGFARVVTDAATFAYLADVFIVPSHRRRGLAKRLMAAVMAHPDPRPAARAVASALGVRPLGIGNERLARTRAGRVRRRVGRPVPIPRVAQWLSHDPAQWWTR